MSEVEAAGRVLGWLVDLYLVVGLMLVVVLVPQVEKALRTYWFSGENAFWTWGLVAFGVLVVWLRSCA